MPPFRKHAIASLDLFDIGSKDPLLIDRGYGFYDIVNQDLVAGGAFSYNSDGVSLLEFIPKIGLVNRAFVVIQDTILSTHFAVSPSNSWDNVRPIGGNQADRKYRLRMYNTDVANTVYTATQAVQFGNNPGVAISLIMKDCPPDWNTATYPPYLRISLGGEVAGAYSLLISGGRDVYLQYAASGAAWTHVEQLGNLRGIGGSDEGWIFVRPIYGKLCISLDFGSNYKVIESLDPDTAITIPSGPLTLRGRGQAIAFGVHQIRAYAGAFDNPPKRTFFSRIIASPSIIGREHKPAGTVIAYSDLSDSFNEKAQARVTLTPYARPQYPWHLYDCPSLQALQFRYPFIRTTTDEEYTNPWDAWILSASVSKPKELAGNTASVTFHQNAHIAFTGDYLWRGVRLKLGYKWDDGTLEWFTSFVGYIGNIQGTWGEEFGKVPITLQLENNAIRLRTAEWSPLDVVALPIVGITANGIGDYVLKSEGLMDEAGVDTTYRNWHSDGALPNFPLGSPFKPFELIKPKEKKWETLTRVFGYRGLEVGIQDDGVFFTLPVDYISGTVDWNFRSTPVGSTDLRDQLRSIEYSMDSRETASCIVVWGESETGETIMMVSPDQQAEGVTTSGRFFPWRVAIQEEVSGSCEAGMIVERSIALARKHFGLKERAGASIPVKPDLPRKARVAIWGCQGVKIPDGQQHVVDSLSHHYKAQSGLGTLETRANLRRVTNI